MPNPFLEPDPNFVPRPQSASANPFLEADPNFVPTNQSALGSYAADIAKSSGSGLVQGVTGLAGGPADVMNMLDRGWQYLSSRALEKAGVLTPQQAEGMRQPIPGLEDNKTRFGDELGFTGLPTSGALNQTIEKTAGQPLYKPQTVPGEYAHTMAEFAPGIVFGSGTAPQRALQIAVPAVASETAGQVARKTMPGMEAPLRVGGALLGAGGVALGQMNRTPEAVLSKALTGATPEDVQKAGVLMQQAEALPKEGVPLTWDEAIQKVTGNATRLTSLRRTVENSQGGAGVFNPLMARRPDQIKAAGDVWIDAIAPNRMDPIETGLRTRSAAQGSIDDTAAAINAATTPYYKAAENQIVDPEIYQQLAQDPIYAGVLKQVRSMPELNRTIETLPDDSVGVVDLVKQRLAEAREAAKAPGQASTSNIAARNFGDVRSEAIAAGEAATGGPTGPYGLARTGQGMLREQFLEPLTAGPMGQIAATDNVLKQGRALLPNGTTALDRPPIISDTVAQLVARDPKAAENVLRHHLGSIFAETTSNIQSGPNQFGGVNFANAVRGNSEQAQALEAFTRALPSGDAKWEGMNRFLDVMEATGRRPNVGSPTAFVQADQQALRSGGVLQEAVKAVPQLGTSVLRRLNDFWDQFNTGRNTAQIARILTDPASGQILEQLAREPVGSGRAANLAFRLSYMGRSAARGAQSGPQSQD